MIITTTPTIEGKKIIEYRGLVFGEVLEGRSLMSGWTKSSVINDFENTMIKAKYKALEKLTNHAVQVGANAVVGITFNYNYISASMSFSVTGTAVVIE